MRHVNISQTFCATLFALLQMTLLASSSFAKDDTPQVSLEDILKSQSVEISTAVDGHYVAGGYYMQDGFGLMDNSENIAADICKKAGYSEALSVSKEDIDFSKDKHFDRTQRYHARSIVLMEYSYYGPMQPKSYDIEMICENDGGCTYIRYAVAIKSVRCKKSATAGDALGANNQVSPHSSSDRRIASQSEKASSNDLPNLNDANSENTANSGSAR